jgi:hypothetical protein
MATPSSEWRYVASLAEHRRLVGGLQRVLAAQGEVRTVETHISTVLLAGSRAYKLKKPVALGFLDFCALAARRRACADEVRLNRRTAPQLYRGVLAITGTPEAPVLAAAADVDDMADAAYAADAADAADAAGAATTAGPAIDYAVCMQRFDPAQGLDALAQRGALPLTAMAPLGRAIAALHAGAVAAPAGSVYGSVTSLRDWTQRTVRGLRDCVGAPADRARVDALGQWCERELQRHAALIEARRAGGRVREGHGDLHLGNVVLLDGVAVPFDALEFNAELRFIDAVGDIAFLWMDLLDHGLPDHAAAVLDAWLEASGDADGLPLLRGFAVYRALVRALVAQLRARQPDTPVAGRVREHASFGHYLTLAERLCVGQPALVVMTGLSGSGKSQVAARLAQRLGGVRVRSDVERKRLAGLDWRDAAPTSPGLYAAAMTARTYARLQAVAGAALDAGLPVVVDAAALRAAERRALMGVADAAVAPACIVECTAPLAVLRRRVAERSARADDPSDATAAVVEAQVQWREPASDDERARWWRIDTAASPQQQAAALDRVVAALRR